MNTNEIVITYCRLNVSKDYVNDMIKYDEDLITAIKDFSENLSNDDIEIFSYTGNSIVTENGYYFAFFEDDLISVE